MKRNTKIFILQFAICVFCFTQLLKGAIIMALTSVLIVYLIGAFENGE